jgi:hypothetical protein
MLGLGVQGRAVCDSMSTNTCESAVGSQGESKYDCKDCQEQRTAQQGYKKGCWRSQRVVLEGKGLCSSTHGIYKHHLANSAVTCAGETSIKDDADNDCRIIHSPIRRMLAGAERKREVALRHGTWEDTMVTRHFGPL